MGKESIPVDLQNPGQVFACMGLLEVAEALLGKVMGGFLWGDTGTPQFVVQSTCGCNAIQRVLDFLGTAQLIRMLPNTYIGPAGHASPKKRETTTQGNAGPYAVGTSAAVRLLTTETFPASGVDAMALPLRLEQDGCIVEISHWCDASSRKPFKLFAGQQRSDVIAEKMLEGVRELQRKHGDQLVSDPFGPTTSLGGSSFKFDARKSWTGIDVGYSPDEQSHSIEASPIVEILAAIGLEHARPREFDHRGVGYSAWYGLAPLILARPALGGAYVSGPARLFYFTLALSGKNKVVTFAREETRHE